MGSYTNSVLMRYGVAAVSIALATWVRLLLAPAVGDRFPFATLLLAILFTSYCGGFRPALVAVLLGSLTSLYFILPSGRSAFERPDQRAGMVLYLGTGLGIALLGGLMKEAQRASEISARALRHQAMLIDLSYDAIFTWDWEGPITFWNRGAERLYGFSRAEASGRVSHTLLQTDCSGGVGAFVGVLERDDYWEGRLHHTTRDGRRVIVESRMVRIRRAERPFVLETNRDITGRLRIEEELRQANDQLDIRDRERAAERLRQTVESAPNGMVMIDREGRIVLVNSQTERLFGYSRVELLGQPVELLVPERFRNRHPEYRSHFFADPGTRSMGVGRDLYALRRDGSEFPVEIGLNPIETEEGVLVLSAIVDITERKRADLALRHLNAELERGIRQLSEVNRELTARTQENEAFVYSVSHDLRSPLVNLQGFSKELDRAIQSLRADLMESDIPQAVRDRGLGVLDGPMEKATRYIRTAVTRLSGIIDALLRLSRAGRVDYQRRRVEVKAIVERVIDSLRSTAEERAATIRTGELPDALGDPAAVEQIFANLIGNALNYLDKGRPGRIEVGSMAPGPDDAGTELRTYFVRDNGLGITEAGRDKMFQPFHRLYPQAAPGEGMGLAIVHRVVERLGGRIWFESVANRGSTFFVALPAFPEDRSTALPIHSDSLETGNPRT